MYKLCLLEPLDSETAGLLITGLAGKDIEVFIKRDTGDDPIKVCLFWNPSSNLVFKHYRGFIKFKGHQASLDLTLRYDSMVLDVHDADLFPHDVYTTEIVKLCATIKDYVLRDLNYKPQVVQHTVNASEVGDHEWDI